MKQQSVRAMSYNIQYGNEGLDSVIAVINEQKPDIVGLQESMFTGRSAANSVNQIELLAKGTGMHFRYAPIYRSRMQIRLSRHVSSALVC